MKKLLSLLLILALVLSGCAPKLPMGEQTTPEQPPAQEEEEQPVPEPEPEPERLDLETVAVEGAPGFYDLSALPQLEGVTIGDAVLLDENTVALLTGEQGDTVRLLNLETGTLETLCTLTLKREEDWGSTSIRWAEPLVVWDNVWGGGFVIARDGSYSTMYPPEEGYIDSWNCVFTREACYWYDSGSAQVRKTACDDPDWITVGSIPVEYYYASPVGLTEDGSGMVLTADTERGEKRVTLVMSLTSGEITAVYEGTECVSQLTGRPQIAIDYPETDETEVAGDGVTADFRQRLRVQRPGEQVEEIVDLAGLGNGESGELGLCGLNPACQETVWGRSLLWTWTETYHLLLWDYRNVTPEEVPLAELVPYEHPVYDLGEISQRADEMEKTYGVRIYLGQEVTSAPFPDYTLEACEDLAYISDALDVLETALAYYPEGYLEQLGGDSVRELCFYLSGRMSPLDASVSIDDPGGLACQVDGLELLAFNVDYIRPQDVVHELTHVLDHWLWAEGTLDEETWSAMNPEDFDYYYAYINENGESYEWAGDTQYTSWDSAYYSGDVDSIYFIDPYSTTFPTEDRARLMEYVLANPGGSPESSFESVHLQEKLTYYFQCIRNTFDTAGWPEQTSWEAALASMAPEAAE